MARPVLLGLLLCCTSAWSEPVQIPFGGLTLNGELQPGPAAPDAGEPIFLIVHGTWAHQGMEIVTALQSALAENGYASLAITLSLGIDDRRGFLDCNAPIRARHEAALPEIGAWLDKLGMDGWRQVILAGHSRGAAQAALFQQATSAEIVRHLMLLGPMVWRKEEVHRSYGARSPVSLTDILEMAAGSSEALMGPYPLLYCDGIEAAPASFLSYYGDAVPKHTPAIVQRLTVPVDIYLGTADTVADWQPEDRDAVQQLPGVRVHDIAGADHFFRDLYLYEAVDDFLSRLP